MAFAQEIKDFLDAYDTVSTVFTNRDRTRLLERQTDIDERYKEAQIKKIDWDIGETGRENEAIIESIDDPYAPFRTSGGGGGGGGAYDVADQGDAGGSGGGSTNTDLAMNYFVSRGLSPIQAAGLVGNLQAESGRGLRTNAVGDAGTAIGIMQARGPRRDALEAAVPDWRTNIQGQLDFVWAELNDPDREDATMRRLLAANTPEEAAAAGIGYERPKGYTPDNPAAGHNFRGRLANTHALAQQYASLTGEGIVAALPGVEAEPSDFDVPEGGDIDYLTGQTSEGGVSGRAGDEDPLGIYDPDYVRYTEGRPEITVPGAIPGGDEFVGPTELVPEVINPPTAETAVTPQAEPISSEPTAVDMEAIATEPRARGFDPLPQTSGNMWPVASAGHESLSPSAQASAQEAMGDADPEPRGFLKAVINAGKKLLGVPDAAIASSEESPEEVAINDGIGGAPLDLIKGIEDRIDPDRKLTNEARMMKVMSVIWNFKMRQGDVNGAYGSAFSVYQSYKVMRDKTLALAKAAVEDGDDTEAVRLFAEAYSLVPDGEIVAATPNPDGTWNIEVKDSQTQEVKSRVLNVDAKQIVSDIMKITPDQFDDLIEERILGGEPEAPDVMPGALDEYFKSRPGADAETAPLPDAGIETTPAPMGATTIPQDQARVPGEEGEAIQTASADPNAPVGDPTKTPLPTSVVTRPVPGAVPPPMTPEEFAKFIMPYRKDKATLDLLTSIWTQDNKNYDDYLKTLPTEADVQSLEAYNKTFEEMRSFDSDVYIPIEKTSIAGVMDTEQQTQLRLIGEAHNKRADEILKFNEEQLKKLELSQSAQKREQLSSEVIPTSDITYAPEQPEQVPGAFSYEDRASMFGAPLEAEGTHVVGRVAERPPDIIPDYTDPRIAEMNPADIGIFEERVKGANVRRDPIQAAFEPNAPLGVGADADAHASDLGAAYDRVAATLTNTTDPVAADAADFMTRMINESDMRGELVSAARVLEDIPANRIADVDHAVAEALSIMSFNPHDPVNSRFIVTRVNPSEKMPAGMVMVQSMLQPDEVLYMPEQQFIKLDNNRQILANAYMARRDDQFQRGQAWKRSGETAPTGQITTTRGRVYDIFNMGLPDPNAPPEEPASPVPASPVPATPENWTPRGPVRPDLFQQ